MFLLFEYSISTFPCASLSVLGQKVDIYGQIGYNIAVS